MRYSFALVASLFCAASVWAKPPSANDVIAVADRHGERVAIERFFDCGPAGEMAYERIATGSAEWLSVAVRLLKASDACVSELLHDSIALALVHAPSRVLPLVNSSPLLSAEKICVPFLSVDENPKKHLQYLRRVQAVLRDVRAPGLQGKKELCIAELKKTREAIELRSNPSIEGGLPTALTRLRR